MTVVRRQIHSTSTSRPARRRRRVGALVAPLALTLALAAMARGDTIVLIGGRTHENVTIISAQYDLVQYKLPKARSAQSVKGDRVQTIVREAQSRDLQLGRKALDAGQFDEAIRRLGRAAGAPEAWEKLEAMYRHGVALAGKGDAKAAEAKLGEYLAAATESKDFWVPSAYYDLGKIQSANKQASAAAKTFKRLAALGGPWEAKAQVGRARAIVEAKKEADYQKAAGWLSSVTRSRSGVADEVKDEAYTLRARIFIARKQYDRAKNELEAAFFHTSGVPRTRYDQHRAEATYLMGRAFLGLGGKDNLETAEIWLLRVAALYPASWHVQRSAALALAKVYKDLGNIKRALEWKKRADGKS